LIDLSLFPVWVGVGRCFVWLWLVWGFAFGCLLGEGAFDLPLSDAHVEPDSCFALAGSGDCWPGGYEALSEAWAPLMVIDKVY
jgi:hypothetical protein